MNHQKLAQQMKVISAGVVLLLLAGCGAPATLIPSTPTPMPPTATLIPSTPTPIPPTATPTLTAAEHLELGIGLAEQRGYEQAIAEYDLAIELDPHLAEVYYRRGQAHLALSNYDQAIADYEQAVAEYDLVIESDPNSAEIYNKRGIVHRNLGEYDQAIADHNHAIELAPDIADSYVYRGLAYSANGDNQQAIDDYTYAIELDPENIDAYYNQALTFTNLGTYSQAIANYTRIIELDPDNAQAYYNRGANYHVQQKYTEALADYDQAIEIDPELAEAYANRGAIYYDQDNLDKALVDSREYVRLAGDYADPVMLNFVARVEAEQEGMDFYTLQFEEGGPVTLGGGFPYFIPSYVVQENFTGEFHLGIEAARFSTSFYTLDTFMVYLQESPSGKTMHAVVIHVAGLDSFYIQDDVVFPENASTVDTNGPFVSLVFQRGSSSRPASNWEITVEQGDQTVSGSLSSDGAFELSNVSLFPIHVTLTDPASSRTYQYTAMPALRGATEGLVSYVVEDITNQ